MVQYSVLRTNIKHVLLLDTGERVPTPSELAGDMTEAAVTMDQEEVKGAPGLEENAAFMDRFSRQVSERRHSLTTHSLQ